MCKLKQKFGVARTSLNTSLVFFTVPTSLLTSMAMFDIAVIKYIYILKLILISKNIHLSFLGSP